MMTLLEQLQNTAQPYWYNWELLCKWILCRQFCKKKEKALHIFVIHLYPYQLHDIILSFVFRDSNWSTTIHLHSFVSAAHLSYFVGLSIYSYTSMNDYRQDNIFGKKIVWRLSNFCKRAWFHRLYLSSWFVSSGQLVQFRCCIRLHVFVSIPDIFFCHNPPKYNCLRNHRVMITDKQSEGRVNGLIFNIMKTSSRHQMGTFSALLALCAGN